MKEHALDIAGSFVDEMFLAPGRLIAYFQARRDINWYDYACQIAFYHEQGYVKDPATFFSPPPPAPGCRIEKQSPYQDGVYQEISFPSLYEPRNPFVRQRYLGYSENRTGYLIRWAHGDKPRKTILCVHGFMMGAPREAERMFKISKLFSMGLDVALCIQPFHWKRIAGPRAARSVYLTLGDTAFTNECVAHSVYDLDNSFSILGELGAANIGIIGASLGGYIAGVYACLRSKPEFVAMMVPSLSFLRPISPDKFYQRAPFDPEWQTYVRRAADFHSPLNLRPRIQADNILVVASRGDKICPFDLVEQLKELWGLSRCHFRTGGHWLVFDKLRGHAWYNFLKEMKYINETSNR
jgi:pimeloyl-ACP methyl ester carboxylesterase